MMYFPIKIFIGLFIVLRCHGLIQNDNHSCPSNFLSLFNMITDERVERLLKEAKLLEKIRNLEAELNNLAGNPSIEEKLIEKENDSCQANFLSLTQLITEERVERRLSQAELLEKNSILEVKLKNLTEKHSFEETLAQNETNSWQLNFLRLSQLISDERAERQILEAKLNNLKAKPSVGETQIAYSGTLSRKIPRSEFGQIVKFDVVTTNIGNAYNIATGIFRCPVAGLYLFSCSIIGDKTNFVIIEVYQDGIKIARPHSGFGANGHESGADTTVVHADVGDEVYSKVTSGGASYLDNFSRFTAVLLKAD